MKQMKVISKRILPILLVLAMMAQVFSQPVIAEAGVQWNVPNGSAVVGEEFNLLAEVTAMAESGNTLAVAISDVASTDAAYNWNGTDTTFTPVEAGEYAVTYSAIDTDNTELDTYIHTVKVANPLEDADSVEGVATIEEAATISLPNSWSSGSNTRVGGMNVTQYITFTNGELTGPGGVVIDEGSNDITFTDSGNYTFKIEFAVNMAALNAATGRNGLNADDYFTFKVPAAFGNASFDIVREGNIWAKVTTDANGNGTVVFTEYTEEKTGVSGGLTFDIYYSEKNAGVTVQWNFEFGATYTFEGTSGGANTSPIVNNPSKGINRKNGGHLKDQIYHWEIYGNIHQESWSGVITLTDTLSSGQKMTNLSGSAESHFAYYGTANYSTPNYYSTSDLSNYTFAIAAVDWDAMRADYTKFYDWSVSNKKATLWVDQDGDGNYADTNYRLQELTSEYSYVQYMWDRMRGWTNTDDSYRYMTPYKDGLKSVTVTDSGFEIEFPDGALDGKSVCIYYYTEMTALIPPSSLTNIVTISGEDVTDTVYGYGVVSSSGYITGTRGEIALYKYDSGEIHALSGAEFQLTEKDIPYNQKQTTGTNGEATFTLHTSGFAGEYILKESTPPAGYSALEEEISITINAAGEITAINGTAISASATDAGTIVSDDEGNAICKVSKDRLILVVYNKKAQTPEPAPVDISRTVEKVWDDENDQDGKRPTSIQVQLLADGTAEGSAVTLNESNGWTYTWNNLPEKQNGTDIVYTVIETGVPADYTASYSTDGFTITNSYTTKTVDISGTKTWSDNNNQDGKRPTSIVVNLLADNVVIDSKAVTAGDSWEYDWIGLDKYAGGVEIKYTITENPVNDYSTVISGYDITNSYTPGETSRTVTKAWNDSSNQDGKRPTSIQVQLLADGIIKGSTITLNEANDWTYTWNNLPEKQNGTDVIYTLTEIGVPTDYTASYSTDGFTITNNYTPETVEKTVTKVWDDANNQDGLRTDHVEVQLYEDGVLCDLPAILNVANNWSYTWSNLEKYNAGVEIEYTVKEINVPDGYVDSYSEDTFTITNNHTVATTERTVTKIWEDANNQDGIRPDRVTVYLKADGVLYDTIILDYSNSWTYKWTDIPLNSNGTEIVYTIIEENVDSYSTTYSENQMTVTITNSYTPESISKTVSKNWDDNYDQDGKRPSSVKVQLFADGTAYAQPVELNAANGWVYTWQGLPEKGNGKTIIYTVEEITEVDGYTATYSNDTFTITNSYTPEVTIKTVKKVWDDGNDKDSLRPSSVMVQLYANGEVYGDPVKLSKTNNWTYTWEGLKKYASGKEVTYTTKEMNVPKGYEVSYSDDTFTITNTHATGTAKIITTTSAKTGDASNIVLWVTLLCISLTGITYLLWMICRRRQHKQR